MTAGQKKWLSTGLTVISLSAGLALNANILKAQAADQPATAASSSSVTAVTASEPTTTDTADKTQESTATETETDDTKTTEKQSAGDEDAENNQSNATDERSDDKVQADTESQTDAKEKTPAEPVAPRNQGSSPYELNDDEKTTGSGEKVSEQSDQSEVVKTVQTQQVTTADNDKKQTVPPEETTDEKTDRQKFVVADSRLFSPRLFLSRMNVPMAASLLADTDDTPVDTPVNTPTPETDEKSGLVYQKVTSIYGDSYTVTGYTPGSSSEVTIPDTFDGAWVTAIGDNAFTGKGLTNVTFGAHITSIGNGAFQNNSLTSVILPDKLGVLGKQAFEHNKLESITFGEHTTAWEISDEAFANNGLEKLSLPDSVTEIDDSAFENNHLKSVQLDKDLTTIGPSAFANNKLNGSLTVPDAVTTVGASAFAGNPDGTGNQLTSVTFSGGLLQEIWTNAFANNNLNTISFTNTDKNTLRIEDSAFALNKNLDQLGLNEGVENIGSNAFEGNNYSGTLKLPNSLETIGTSAFAGNHITGLTMNTSESKLNSIGENAFLNNAIDGNLELANSLDSIGVSAFQGNKITDVKFGSSSKIIGDYSFADNPFNVTDNENTLIIPDSVTTIGAYAFSRKDDNSLKEQIPKVKLGKFVATIGSSAFENVGLAGALTIPDSVQNVGSRAFADNELSDLTLGAGIVGADRSVGNEAFAENALKKIHNTPEELAYVGDDAFANQKELSVGVAREGNYLTGVTDAIKAELGLTLTSPVFTYKGEKLDYVDSDGGTLTLPGGFIGTSLVLAVSSGTTGGSTDHSGNYGVEDLTLTWTPQSSGSGTSTTTPDTPTNPATSGTSTPTTSTTPKNKSPKSKHPKAKHPTTKSNKTTSKQPAGNPTRQTATQYPAQPQGHRATATARRPQSLSWDQLTTTPANGTSTPTTGWHYSQAQGIWVWSAGTLTPATSATLPQTREQPATGWQLVGLALLSGLSWFGLRRKHN